MRPVEELFDRLREHVGVKLWECCGKTLRKLSESVGKLEARDRVGWGFT